MMCARGRTAILGLFYEVSSVSFEREAIMKTRSTMMFAKVAVIAGLAGWQLGAVSSAWAGDDAKFVGSKKCKMCHSAQFKSWESMSKSKTLEALMPGNAAEAKTKHNLDPAKDYSTDPACLKCHSTGFGHDGGYFVPDAADEKAVTTAAKLAGVGCESCHGAGDAYNELHKEIKKSKRMYKADEMYAAGMNKIEESVCTACHNDTSPTYDASKAFDFAAMKDKGAHDHSALKQREN
jgi:hypothetical protein